MRINPLILFLLAGGVLLLTGCSYTFTSAEGRRVTSAQIQEIKLGRTTELDLIKLGPEKAMNELIAGLDGWTSEPDFPRRIPGQGVFRHGKGRSF
jgi:hypothetical protein